MNTYICQQCGKEFNRYSSDKKKGTFCSLGCYHDSMKKSVEIECSYCGKMFSRKPYKVRGEKSYCSRECSSKSQVTRVNKKCSTCGAEFLIEFGRVREHNFCCKECANKFPRTAWNKGTHFSPTAGKELTQEHREKISLAQRGEKHWNWQNGKTSLARRIRVSMEYRSWRSKVYKRDNYTCQFCGAYGTELNAHHIEEFSKNENRRFDVDNGITLCVPCHHAVHGKHLKVEVANG